MPGRDKTSGRRDLRLLTLSSAATRGLLQAGSLRLPCAIGRGGLKAIKREGDGASPMGRWQLLHARYRQDKSRPPTTALPLRPTSPSDGWCDAPSDRNYNRPIRHPYPASAERMWREDDLYDLVVVLDYNLRPRCRGRGSAIFMHVAKPGLAPTEGCIALRVADLRKVLAVVRRSSHLIVGLHPRLHKKGARSRSFGR